MKRRDFLGIIGGSAAGVTLGHFGLRRLLSERNDPAYAGVNHLGLRSERQALSVCGGCTAGCSVSLRIVDEAIVGIRGNPLCPLGAGGLCTRGASEVEAFYDPDRLIGPVERHAARGAGRWDRISWDVALEKIVNRLRDLAMSKRGQRVGAIMSSADGVNTAVVRRVLAGIGSPHIYTINSQRDEAAAAYSSQALGSDRLYGFDLENTDLIMSFGTPLLEGWLSPAYVARRFGEGRRRAQNRLRLIHVDSRMSPTALSADEWIRCTPGKEPLLALGMAGVMMREGLTDPRALESIVGLVPWADKSGGRHPGFQRVLEYAYAPNAVSEETGVPVVEIIRLARTFARAAAPVAVAERTAGSAGVFGLAAGHLLNAITDRVGRRGGMIIPRPAPVTTIEGAEVPGVGRLDHPPTVPIAGIPVWRVLGGLHSEGKEPPFDVLFIEDGAALGDLVAGDPAFELLKGVPLVISLATGLDASTAIADIVLPSTTSFEQTIDVETPVAGGFVAVAAARRAVAPLVDGRPLAQTFMDLGRRLGGAAKLPKDTVEQLVDHRLHGLFRARRGMPYGTPFRRNWMAQMEGAGWWSASARSEKEFVNLVYERGGWVDPLVPEEPPSPEAPYAVDGRWRKSGTSKPLLFPLADVDDAWVPHARPFEETADPDETIILVPFTVGAMAGRGTPNRPTILQIAAPHVHGAFRPWAELHPADAHKLAIDEYGWIRLISEFGEVTLTVRIHDGVQRGTVAVPWAPAAVGGGRYSRSWSHGAEQLAAGVFGSAGFRTVAALRVRAKPAKEPTL